MSSRPISSLRLPAFALSQLTQAGYTSIKDLQDISGEALAQDLKVPLSDAEAILSVCQTSTITQTPNQPILTQSAASIARAGEKISTGSLAADNLLSGGISRGQVIEISGPPSTPKEAVAISIVKTFVEAGHDVIFVDCQNMTSPTTLAQTLRKTGDQHYLQRVHYTSALSLSELMAFMYHLPKLVKSHPHVALLVVNSISFPFQAQPDLTASARNALLEKLKQVLTVVSMGRNIAIVTTSQLSTKMLNANGSPANFDTPGAKGVLVPQLGLTYLPGSAYRMILAAESDAQGVMMLLSTPGDPQGVRAPRPVPYKWANDGTVS